MKTFKQQLVRLLMAYHFTVARAWKRGVVHQQYPTWRIWIYHHVELPTREWLAC